MKYAHGYITKLARKAGITRSYLSYILSGKKRPQYPIAKRLAEITETGPWVWLEGDPKAIYEAIDQATILRRQRLEEEAFKRGDYEF